MASNDSASPNFQDTFSSEIIQTSKVHFNLAQDVVVITEDKLRLCLKDHLDRLVAKHKWVAPISLFITFIVVLVTSTFREYLFPAATWQAIFVLCTIGSAIWSVLSVIDAVKSNTKLDALISEIKKTSEALRR